MSTLVQGLVQGTDGTIVPLRLTADGAVVTAGSGEGAPGGTSDTTEATQLLVKTAVQSINTKTPALQGGAVPVNASARVCLGQELIALTSGSTASLTVPGSAVAAHIQADGATIRIRLDAVLPTAAFGTRLDDGVIYPIDTVLSNVRLYGTGASNVQVTYFDRA